MPLTAYGSATVDDVECEVSDEDIVEYVTHNPKLMEQIRVGYEPLADMWADAFVNEDAVGQEQMLAALRRVCPHMTIGFGK
jgi:hypothetical protein